MPDAEPFGFLNVDKPLGLTSHDVVSRVRRIFGIKKVGHAGTLDPLATGVLVVCVGTATRLSEYAMASTKSYQAQVHLGVTTTSYDAEGDVVTERDAADITQAQVEQLLSQFTGNIEQLPPMYSAVKKDGKKLYELAREGKEIEREPRPVRIDELEILSWQPPLFSLRVVCGSGTYIRSLAHDIGEALGVGAHLAGLQRTRSGNFRVEDAVNLDTLAKMDQPQQALIDPLTALSDYLTVTLDGEALDDVQHGRTTGQTDLPDDELALALDIHGTFIAILRAQRGKWRPHKVFSSAS